jgi:hypothetical protein
VFVRLKAALSQKLWLSLIIFFQLPITSHKQEFIIELYVEKEYFVDRLLFVTMCIFSYVTVNNISLSCTECVSFMINTFYLIKCFIQYSFL